MPDVVRADDQLVAVGRGLASAITRGETGIQNDPVELIELCNPITKRPRGCQAAQVERHRLELRRRNPSPQCGERSIRLRLIAAGDNHLGAGRRELLRGEVAETGISSSDEDRAAGLVGELPRIPSHE